MKCKCCGVKFTPKTFLQKFCMEKDECIKAFVKFAKEKKQSEAKNKEDKFKQVEKEYNYEKKLKASLKNTKIQVHAYIRKRDENKPCISCRTPWKSDFQCGHHYKSETFETLKFHLDNLAGQCRRCNLFLDGSFDNYALNLPKRIGKERYENLVKLAETDKQYSKVWNLENLKEVRKLLKDGKSYIIQNNLNNGKD